MSSRCLGYFKEQNRDEVSWLHGEPEDTGSHGKRLVTWELRVGAVLTVVGKVKLPVEGSLSSVGIRDHTCTSGPGSWCPAHGG